MEQTKALEQLAFLAAQAEAMLTNPNPPTARDWAGFFAALAELIKIILPIILPLIQPTKE